MTENVVRDPEGRIICDLEIIGSSRIELRHKAITTWLRESPGERYRYNVETGLDGRRVYLKRPAHLNKGCDFKIFIEKHLYYKNGNEKPPKHDDMISDVVAKVRSFPQHKKVLYDAITRVFRCEEPDIIINDFRSVSFNEGLPFDLLLKALKWFFIEQDVTDWNYSGRNMLYDAISTNF